MKKFLFIEIPTHRNFGLDLLRFIAIMMVMINHSQLQIPHVLRKPFQFLIFDGVLVFFVLSGFLIGSIIINQFENTENNFSSLINFWFKRWFRTLPAYLFVLSIIIFLSTVSISNFDIHKTFSYYFFIQSFLYHDGYFFPEAWSLAIEEWFYLLFPLLLLVVGFAKRVPFKTRILIVILFFILGSIFLREYFFLFRQKLIFSQREWDMNFRSVTIFRLDSIGFGILIAFIKKYYISVYQFLNKFIFAFIGFAILIFLRFYQLLNDDCNNSWFMCVL